MAVADGLGGHVGGDVASRTALQAVDRVVTAARLDEDDTAELLVGALREANREVLGEAREDPSLKGMGTTVVLAHLAADGRALTVAHVGDSRAYALRDTGLSRLTQDHVRGGLLGRTLTQAVGTGPDLRPGVTQTSLDPGDRLLLCTDGLTDMLEEATIADLLAAEDDEAATCGSLVDAALSRGGVDNVTVIVATVTGQSARGAADPDAVAEAGSR